jgi:hypothetical protein
MSRVRIPVIYRKSTFSMKDTNKKLVKGPESALLSLVADRLKDRVLFPEKIEEVKKYLKQAKVKIS